MQVQEASNLSCPLPFGTGDFLFVMLRIRNLDSAMYGCYNVENKEMRRLPQGGFFKTMQLENSNFGKGDHPCSSYSCAYTASFSPRW